MNDNTTPVVATSTRRHFTAADATGYSLIRRGHTEPEYYTVISNEWVRDPRLSWKAKGIMAGVLSHADGWDGFSLDWLVAHGTDRIDAVRSGVRELEALGYLVRTEYRVSGRARTDWATADPTGSDNPRRREPADSPGRISRGGSAEAENPRAKKTTHRTPEENTTDRALNTADAASNDDEAVDESERRGRPWRAGDEIPHGTVARLRDALDASGLSSDIEHDLALEVAHLRTLPDWRAITERVATWCGIQASVESHYGDTESLIERLDEAHRER